MYNLEVSAIYNAPASEIFEAFKNGLFFSLTGADDIRFEFSEGGSFEFHFTGRGRIYGKVGQIIADEKMVMDWNVEGFNMENEYVTRVTISLDTAVRTTATIMHENIPTSASQAMKKRAWTE